MNPRIHTSKMVKLGSTKATPPHPTKIYAAMIAIGCHPGNEMAYARRPPPLASRRVYPKSRGPSARSYQTKTHTPTAKPNPHIQSHPCNRAISEPYSSQPWPEPSLRLLARAQIGGPYRIRDGRVRAASGERAGEAIGSGDVSGGGGGLRRAGVWVVVPWWWRRRESKSRQCA